MQTRERSKSIVASKKLKHYSEILLKEKMAKTGVKRLARQHELWIQASSGQMPGYTPVLVDNIIHVTQSCAPTVAKEKRVTARTMQSIGKRRALDDSALAAAPLNIANVGLDDIDPAGALEEDSCPEAMSDVGAEVLDAAPDGETANDGEDDSDSNESDESEEEEDKVEMDEL